MQSIIHGDCLDEMRKMEANSISCIVTDPPYGLGFMGKHWDAGLPHAEIWKEALRVVKPGGFLLAFGGTRTYHRLTCAVEDAGWEIRDCLMWLYGSGFPKSHNIGKALDKEKGINRPLVTRTRVDGKLAGGIVTKGFISGVSDPSLSRSDDPISDIAKNFDGFGTALKPAYEPIIMAMKPCNGTFAQNAEKWGQAGINIDECRIGHDEPEKITFRTAEKSDGRSLGNYKSSGFLASPNEKGRWPANVIFDEEAAQVLDEQSGVLKSGTVNSLMKPKTNEVYGKFRHVNINEFKPNSGGASRFFYCAKTSPSERGKDNKHPTVKPIKLMEYLLKLVMPPSSGIVLDPFAGSGSTIVAAKRLGFNAIGIEKEKEYCEIAEKRVENAKFEPVQLEMKVV